MTLLVWILLGLIASHIVDHGGAGIVLDMLLGIIGAFVGGWLFRAFGHTGVTGLNLHSALVAAVGAIVLLFVYHAIRRVTIGSRRRFLR